MHDFAIQSHKSRGDDPKEVIRRIGDDRAAGKTPNITFATQSEKVQKDIQHRDGKALTPIRQEQTQPDKANTPGHKAQSPTKTEEQTKVDVLDNRSNHLFSEHGGRSGIVTEPRASMQTTVARENVPKEPPTILPGPTRGWRSYVNSFLAGEVSAVTRYYDRVVQWLPREEDTGQLLAALDAPRKEWVGKDDDFPDLSGENEKRTAVLVNGTFNHDFDIQGLLMQLKSKLARTSRVIVILYNPYLRWLYYFTNRLGIRKGELPSTFVTRVDLENIAKVAGFEVVSQRLALYCPWRMCGLGTAVNRVLPLVPLLRWLCLTSVVVLRPLMAPCKSGVSCVVPARNERGNIENVLKRFPDLGCETEIIFVEGHSTDGTWEEILRVAALYKDRFRILAVQQPGKGKADAVRLGFSHAREDLLVILDADLTMPPEMLSRFCQAYNQGYGDFINGSRLIYPMEGAAMRFLNRMGNIFFAKLLSSVLGVRLGDSLCGTKLLARHDYQRMVAWRRDFGEFDPFGDFELLFPAAVLGLRIVDVPVRYLARTYGQTNIERFRHGLLLLKMTWVGLIRIKMGIRKRSCRGGATAAA